MNMFENKSIKKKPSTIKILVFGSNKSTQLIISPDVVLKPTFVDIECTCLTCAACGMAHTLFCLCDGVILCSGDNSQNQFGKIEIKSHFEKVSGFKDKSCISVACGDYFSLALTSNGETYSWGDNGKGQLGRENDINKVAVIPSLSHHFIIQVSCGHGHSLALSRDSIIFSWGDNQYGQLGLGNDSSMIIYPQIISSLDSLPIKQVSCGEFFSMILTPSGSVYSWGNNIYGQLGIGILPADKSQSKDPVYLKSIKGIRIVYISSGNNHCALLTNDGGIFTFGNGRYGQLGHGGVDNQCTPRKVADLMGSIITQISCGNDFTLVYIDDVKKIYGFGRCDQGQLGLEFKEEKVLIPKMACDFNHLKRNSSHTSKKTNSSQTNDSVQFRVMYSGGNHTVLFLTDDNYPSAIDQRVKISSANLHIVSITEVEISTMLHSKKVLSDDFLSHIYLVFGSFGCLSASFLDKSEKNNHYLLSKTNHGVDIDAAYNFMLKMIEHFSEDELEMLRVHMFENLLSMRLNLKNYPGVECIRGFLVLLISPLLNNPKSYDMLTIPLLNAINNFSLFPRNILDSWISKLRPRYFKKIVEALIGIVNYHLSELPSGILNKIPEKSERQMISSMNFLKEIYAINERLKIISYTQFYVSSLNDKIDIEKNFIEWATANSNYRAVPFSFCSYPFVFDTKAKTKLLQVEAGLFMRNAILETHTNIIMALLTAQETDIVTMEDPFFVIGVNRETILEDTLKSLESASSRDFKKPLKISFSNEEAEDDGGVIKEYFLLVIREIMLPKYGLFKCFQHSNMCYFEQCVKDKDNIYRCVGQLCGLAIYNGVIVDLHFPLALFKKLLDEVPDLEDILELDPVLGKSMQQILDYHKSDFHDVFGLYHEIVWEDKEGVVHLKELMTNGSTFPVTKDNKEQYIIDYVHFILNENVKSSFDAFKLGFYLVCVGSVLKLFRPLELQEMTVGCEISDWKQLENNAKYQGEYWKGHKVIIWFWNVFKDLKEVDKKCFLRFLTGCDRAPITGLNSFTIVIQSTNGGDNFYPVAHTCYNLLDLPIYSSKEILKSRLIEAISYTEGFTLV